MGTTMRRHYLAAILLAALVLGPLSWQALAAPRPTTLRPEHVVQVKLRDLFDMVPRKDAAEVIARLKAIEERLVAIEALLRNAPVPLPAPVPVTGTGR